MRFIVVTAAVLLVVGLRIMTLNNVEAIRAATKAKQITAPMLADTLQRITDYTTICTALVLLVVLIISSPNFLTNDKHNERQHPRNG